MLPAYLMLAIIAGMYGVAGIDSTLKGNHPASIMYYGLVVVNLALAWIEYHR